MKKVYEAPSVEKVEFQYRDQVVAASGCISAWINEGDRHCPVEDQVHVKYLD